MLFLSPESLKESKWRKVIGGLHNIACIAFDEVHCLSTWWVLKPYTSLL